MPREFYEKVKNEFKPVGIEFSGFPHNGLWLVEDGKSDCIIPMGDKPTRPSKLLMSYMSFAEELSDEYITHNFYNGSFSVHDFAKFACTFFAKKAGAIEVNNELIEH